MNALTSRALWLACGLALAAGAIHAQTSPPADAAAARKALDEARADLDRAARRVAELSRASGAPEAPMVLERRFQRSPVLGVVLAPDADKGVRIAAVTPGSAAARAGLRSGDRLLAVDGQTVAAADADARLARSRELLSDLSTDTPVSIAYERDGTQRTLALTPTVSERVMVFRGGDGTTTFPRGRVHWQQAGDGRLEVEADGFTHVLASGDSGAHETILIRGNPDGSAQGGVASPMVAPRVRTEIIDLGRADCAGGTCASPLLMEAFRWNGLNLASVDASLGRYFGTGSGVLVLSTGPELKGLQSGDVIRKVDGKPVATPREAMDALRGKPSGSRVAVEYLRDRKTAIAQVTVPEPMVINIPRPPAPPPPPPAPAAPDAVPPPVPTPPTPPAPPSTAVPAAPAPPPPPPAPAAPGMEQARVFA
ncbi:PDZ domain-containing protein [Marilutibacter spongiae]|uniref:PDZ domain-containing protein n=1 Tax=Marilutibacter spongiae TaxID=2025720 RepID=A0A7W3Y5N5_9GAMM|nr:PDZ domain-containing protein [Lysobacter spongiae]MBB1060106.1 PDZ domain-containing protein [Lysobacter spongiae]